VGEVAALVEAQAEHGVARLEQRQVDRHVGVGARVGLDVGVLGAEEALARSRARSSTSSMTSLPP
jgi:hypothetical protein